MCHYKSIGGAMKGVTVLVLVSGLASVLALEPIPFKLREITQKSIYTGVGPRIYGGSEAYEGQFPFMVFTLMRVLGDRVSQCSASLIQPDLVLLAAHCVKFPRLRPKDVIVVAGKANVMPYVENRLRVDYYEPIFESMFGLQERRPKEIHIHREYNPDTLFHDIAFLRLEKPFHLVPGFVETIPISMEEMETPLSCTILGWGLTRGNIQRYRLNYVEDRLVSSTRLGCSHKPFGPFLCLKPSDSGICQGDSGSPLVCGGKVLGVASHFLSREERADCGDSVEEFYSEIFPELKMVKQLLKSGGKSAAVSFCPLVLSLALAFLSLRDN